MDLKKFVLMLTERELFVPSLASLAAQDPYESYPVPEQLESWRTLFGHPLAHGLIAELREAAVAAFPNIKMTDVDRHINDLLSRFKTVVNTVPEAMSSIYGASCWHADFESEAMWKLYAGVGQGLAIESTVDKLTQVFPGDSEAVVDWVCYRDFGSQSFYHSAKTKYGFTKRHAYEYEKELRVRIKFAGSKDGIAFPISPESLIAAVHVSPFADELTRKAIKQLCSSLLLTKPLEVAQSPFLIPPACHIFETRRVP